MMLKLLLVIGLVSLSYGDLKERMLRHLTSYDYDYLVFAIEWPASVCKVEQCNRQFFGTEKVEETWNIHGLWPSGSPQNECSFPSFCTKSDFNSLKLNSQLKNKISSYWNGIFQSTDTFLQQQWQQHGTCYKKAEFDSQNYTPQMRGEAYYKAVFQLQSKYDPVKLLAKSGIVPSNNKPYAFNTLYEAFKKELKIPDILFICHTEDQKQYLVQARIYLNDDLTPIKLKCSKQRCNMRQQIYYPEFPKSSI